MTSCLDIAISRIGQPISFQTERIGEGLTFGASRVGEPISFRCGLVCSVSEVKYLMVEPENIWLLPENGFSQDVVVYSNVTWVIE